MRPARLLAVAVLAVVLALSSAQNAFSSQWIVYDNNSPGGDWDARFVGVRFSLPNGVSSAHLLAVSFYWILDQDGGVGVQGAGMMAMSPQNGPEVVVHITGAPPSTATELTSSISLTPIEGWNPVDVSSRNIIISGDFYVAIEQLVLLTVAFDSTSSNFEDRSVYGNSLDTMTNLCCGDDGASRNFMIRAEIDPIAPLPVGGIVTPLNAIATLWPWLAVIGLMTCIGTAVVVAKKGRP